MFFKIMMTKLFSLFIFFSSVYFIGSSTSNASDNVEMDYFLDQAVQQKLHEDPYWSALLHYKSRTFGRDGVLSDVHTDQFFLSETGKTNPASELKATIHAIFALQDMENPDSHAQCLFVARFNWLKSRLEWPNDSFPVVSCPGYKKWSHDGQVESISFIFASGYLDNPASYFGHPLLRFNRAEGSRGNNLLDTSINYGAITQGTDNVLIYAAKGLFGGYEAGFTRFQFYYHNHNYGENELRDLWEYQLDLTEEQVNQIVSHTWELKGNKFPYFFLHDNCAYRMSELLEMVVEKPLLPSNVPYSIPYTIYDRLSEIYKDDGLPLVKRVTRIPSRQSRLYGKYSSLGAQQQAIVKSFTLKEYDFGSEAYQALPAQEKIDVIETLLDYYSLRVSKEGVATAYNQEKQLLLLERLKLPARKAQPLPSSNEIKPPHEGQRPVLNRVGVINNSNFGAGLEIRLRPAYYDLIAPETGRLPNSSLSVFDLKVAAFENEVILRQLDFLSIETLNIARTDLPGDGGLAWKFRFGLESQDLSCKGCTTFSVDGGAGLATEITKSLIGYATVEGRLQTKQHGSGMVAATPRIGLLGALGDQWKILVNIGYRTYLDERQSEEPIIKVENRFGDSRVWDIRASYEEHVARQFNLSFSYYW
jgi:hypothetical protein